MFCYNTVMYDTYIQLTAEIVLCWMIICLSVMESMTVKMEMMSWIVVSLAVMCQHNIATYELLCMCKNIFWFDSCKWMDGTCMCVPKC